MHYVETPYAILEGFPPNWFHDDLLIVYHNLWRDMDGVCQVDQNKIANALLTVILLYGNMPTLSSLLKFSFVSNIS